MSEDITSVNFKNEDFTVILFYLITTKLSIFFNFFFFTKCQAVNRKLFLFFVFVFPWLKLLLLWLCLGSETPKWFSKKDALLFGKKCPWPTRCVKKIGSPDKVHFGFRTKQKSRTAQSFNLSVQILFDKISGVIRKLQSVLFPR